MKKKKKLEKLKQKIQRHLRENPKKSFNYKQLSALYGFNSTQDRNAVIQFLQQLKGQKLIYEPKRGVYMWGGKKEEYFEGKLEIIGSGNGYVVLEDKDDIFVARKNLEGAFHGDWVKVFLYPKKNRGRSEGEIAEIVQRKKINFVGTLQRQKDFGFVLTQGIHMYTDFFIPREELKAFEDGDKVEVELTDWPKKASSPNGKILRSLGKPGDLNTEINTILLEYGLPATFEKELEEAANQIPTAITQEEIDKRKDFRKVLTFTIDPVSAKDFDDAISFQKLKNGHYEIGVHIADVSHYVDEESILDDEAYQRGTSVYLVDRVVPMLPENLSNGLCSLRPNEEKLTYAVIFEVDSKGAVHKEWFGKTVICSNHRFAYEEIQYVLDTNGAVVAESHSLTGKEYTIPKSSIFAISELNRLAQLYRKQRMLAGAISFDRKEIQFSLDEKDHPESVYFKESKEAHQLIEEWMLMANRSVATFIGKQNPKKPFVYRVHDEPDQDKLDNLQQVVKTFGYAFNSNSKQLNKEINSLLKTTHGKKEQHMIDTLTLRCMSKAVYTTDNIGHYGLGFDYYSHFTSPIRRYPDVLVHRLLDFYLNGGKNINKELLEEACNHTSQREQLATKAERESIKFMQVKFMEDKVGQEFDGIISGITERGIYVEIINNKCEGMIAARDISGDYFYFDGQQHAMIGQKTNQTFTLGDPISIVVKSANLSKKQLDFVLPSNN